MSDLNYKLFFKSSDVWNSLLEDINSATSFIDIERYIFCVDAVGMKFIEALEVKARSGIKVRIIADMVGSLGLYLSSEVKRLQRAGVEVVFFNPISLWRIGNFTSNFFRDHGKLAIIDNKIGYIGGVGIDETNETWRDTEIRVEGAVVSRMNAVFDRMWRYIHTGKFVFARVRNSIERDHDVLINAPRFGRRSIYKAYLAKIRASKSYAYLTTPYFIPDFRMLATIRRAAKRGVDVRLLIPRSTEYRIINYSMRSYYTLLLSAGVKLYEYTPSMLHAKTAVVDDVWATVGTFNLDNLSSLLNYEVNICSSDTGLIQSLKDQFMKDIAVSKEVKLAEWKNRSLMDKIKEFVTWPFHKIL